VSSACQGVFVAGTDTEVGKTFVSAALVAGLRDQGLDVGYSKPVSTDGIEQGGRLVSPDAFWVAQASGLDDPPLSMNPFCLAHALSPLAAARLENVDLNWDQLVFHVRAGLQGHDAYVCEGVGGVMVPLLSGLTTLNLMAELEMPVVIAARPGLGTINHTLLTMQAVRKRGLEVLGFIFFGQEENQERAEAGVLNSQLISEFSDAAFLGALPWVEKPSAAELANAVNEHINLQPIVDACA
jgi:dethiobiotin synthetase